MSIFFKYNNSISIKMLYMYFLNIGKHIHFMQNIKRGILNFVQLSSFKQLHMQLMFEINNLQANI